MKTFCFTVDDNVLFLRDLTVRRYESIFDHPYLAVYRRLHERFGAKVQLNLFYRTDGFDLSQMTDAYYAEWEANADWLRLSFHSDHENVNPYAQAPYAEVFDDCRNVNRQIVRFASPAALAKTTTVHYCLLTEDGKRAMEDCSVRGLLGLFGTQASPRTSYGIPDDTAHRIRNGETVTIGKIAYASIDLVLNQISKESIPTHLSPLTERPSVRIMIHEQYFYEDYKNYQPDFEKKLITAISFLRKHGYASVFFENTLSRNGDHQNERSMYV